MIRVKVCGITNLEDALAAAELGADALGFVLAASPRQVTPENLRHLVAELPPLVLKVGVFVDSPLEEVRRVMSDCGLNLAQLHGSESPEYCEALFPRAIKAFQVKDATVLKQLPLYRASAYLLDGYHSKLKGGSGQSFDWEIARQAKGLGRIILSGGLTPENVAQAIAIARPYGVDVSSGVEASPGKKDHRKLAAFIQAVKESNSEAA
jgi:phosphoribosylanthranilate isomerase